MNEQEIAEQAITLLTEIKESLLEARANILDAQQCPRAEVLAIILDEGGTFLGIGENRRPQALGSCDCNDNAPTMKKGSQTCLAIHAEMAAVFQASRSSVFNDMHFIISTRPPCRTCLSGLLNTPIQTIVTTDDWEDRDNSRVNWEKAGRTWIVVENK